jgi:hypothetical protein
MFNYEHSNRAKLGYGTPRPAHSACVGLRILFCFTHNLAYDVAMRRKLVWIENRNFEGFGSSECNWLFRPLDAVVGDSLDEMKQKYEARRDKEFAAHLCAEHPRAASPKTE